MMAKTLSLVGLLTLVATPALAGNTTVPEASPIQLIAVAGAGIYIAYRLRRRG